MGLGRMNKNVKERESNEQIREWEGMEMQLERMEGRQEERWISG